MLVANSESFISTDYADYTDQDKRLSHKKAQEAQKEISLICPCAFCASLWLVSVLCNLRNLWMFTWSLPPPHAGCPGHTIGVRPAILAILNAVNLRPRTNAGYSAPNSGLGPHRVA